MSRLSVILVMLVMILFVQVHEEVLFVLLVSKSIILGSLVGSKGLSHASQHIDILTDDIDILTYKLQMFQSSSADLPEPFKSLFDCADTTVGMPNHVPVLEDLESHEHGVQFSPHDLLLFSESLDVELKLIDEGCDGLH